MKFSNKQTKLDIFILLLVALFHAQSISAEERTVSFCATPPINYLMDEKDDKLAFSQRGIISKDLRWPNGKMIKVAFNFYGQDFRRAAPTCHSAVSRKDCESKIKKQVANMASRWSQYGNIYFRFDVPWNQGEIRIKFVKGGGGHSYVGTTALGIHKNENTMQLGVSHGFESTILHEFGHALGFNHEHQSPKVRYTWNERNIAQYLGWSISQVVSQITTPLNQVSYIRKTDLFMTEFDPYSIMIYFIPRSWVSSANNANRSLCPSTNRDFCVEPTHELSRLDKLAISKMYPRNTTTVMRPTAPQRMFAKALSRNSIRVNWTDDSKNEKGFYLYRWNDSKWSRIATISANRTTYTDTRLYPNSTYYYLVTAYNNHGESRYKSYVLAKTLSKRQHPEKQEPPENYPRCADGNMKREGNKDCCLDRSRKKRCFYD